MIVAFRTGFIRDLRKLKDQQLCQRVKNLIEQAEQAPTLDTLPGLRKLRGEGSYYRIRMGDYRCGIAVENNVVTFIRFLHRREIYRYFP